MLTHSDIQSLQAENVKLRTENAQLREEIQHLREERTQWQSKSASAPTVSAEANASSTDKTKRGLSWTRRGSQDAEGGGSSHREHAKAETKGKTQKEPEVKQASANAKSQKDMDLKQAKAQKEAELKEAAAEAKAQKDMEVRQAKALKEAELKQSARAKAVALAAKAEALAQAKAESAAKRQADAEAKAAAKAQAKADALAKAAAQAQVKAEAAAKRQAEAEAKKMESKPKAGSAEADEDGGESKDGNESESEGNDAPADSVDDFFLIRFGPKRDDEKTQADVMAAEQAARDRESAQQEEEDRRRAQREETAAEEGLLVSERGLRSGGAEAVEEAAVEEVIQTLVLTQAQLQAAQRAEEIQLALWMDADGAPEKIKQRVGSYWGSHCGGPAMERLLDGGAELIDAQYLVALGEAGGVLPRWQDVPDVARITSEGAWRLKSWNDPYRLPVLVLSCPWLDSYHPDRLGEQLKRLVPVFKAIVEESKRYSTYGTMGVLWDYCALPQLPYGDEQSDGESMGERFERGRRGMHHWFSHPHTFVLMVNELPGQKKTGLFGVGGPKYKNMRKYEERGWCLVERRLSAVVKSQGRLWDLSRFDQLNRSFDQMQRLLKAPRPPPISPEQLALDLREAVGRGEVTFTIASDLELALKIYERGFIAAINDFAYNHTSQSSKNGDIFYRNLKWGDNEADEIEGAMRYATENCDPLGTRVFHVFDGNKFTHQAKERIQAAATGSRIRVDN